METSRSRQDFDAAASPLLRRPGSPLLRPPTSASPEEAAAVIAALEQFLADTAPAPTPAPAGGAEPPLSPWKRAALAEGVARQPEAPGSWSARGAGLAA